VKETEESRLDKTLAPICQQLYHLGQQMRPKEVREIPTESRGTSKAAQLVLDMTAQNASQRDAEEIPDEARRKLKLPFYTATGKIGCKEFIDKLMTFGNMFGYSDSQLAGLLKTQIQEVAYDFVSELPVETKNSFAKLSTALLARFRYTPEINLEMQLKALKYNPVSGDVVTFLRKFESLASILNLSEESKIHKLAECLPEAIGDKLIDNFPDSWEKAVRNLNIYIGRYGDKMQTSSVNVMKQVTFQQPDSRPRSQSPYPRNRGRSPYRGNNNYRSSTGYRSRSRDGGRSSSRDRQNQYYQPMYDPYSYQNQYTQYQPQFQPQFMNQFQPQFDPGYQQRQSRQTYRQPYRQNQRPAYQNQNPRRWNSQPRNVPSFQQYRDLRRGQGEITRGMKNLSLNPEQPRGNKPSLVCFNCNQEGHIASQCNANINMLEQDYAEQDYDYMDNDDVTMEEYNDYVDSLNN